MSRRFLVVSHPGSRRAEGFLAAARRDAALLPWSELLDERFDPERHFRGLEVLRIDSPSGHPDTERELLARGAVACQREGLYPHLQEATCRSLPDDNGCLRLQRQWFLGWRTVLRRIGEWRRHFGFEVMNDPRSIECLFDKLATREALEREGVPVPPASGLCRNFDQLEGTLREHRWSRVFLKPCHGSAGSGVIALARHPQRGWRAHTTVELDRDGRIRNRRRVRELGDIDEIHRSVDAVCRQRALVERWFPKATFEGRPFDLRVVVVAGQAAHVAVRSSPSPITNLHLANRRADPAAIEGHVGRDRWEEAMRTAEGAARAFPDCHYLGVDVMIDSRHRRCAVAEVNAFGDHLHHETWQGMNPWELEVACWRTPASYLSGPS